MKKILFIIIFVAISYASSVVLYPHVLKKLFNVSGTISIAKKHKKKPNAMLFIVLKNKGNIPVAIKKVINPSFPLDFNLNVNDLIMPDLLSKKLYIEAIRTSLVSYNSQKTVVFQLNCLMQPLLSLTSMIMKIIILEPSTQ